MVATIVGHGVSALLLLLQQGAWRGQPWQALGSPGDSSGSSGCSCGWTVAACAAEKPPCMTELQQGEAVLGSQQCEVVPEWYPPPPPVVTPSCVDLHADCGASRPQGPQGMHACADGHVSSDAALLLSACRLHQQSTDVSLMLNKNNIRFDPVKYEEACALAGHTPTLDAFAAKDGSNALTRHWCANDSFLQRDCSSETVWLDPPECQTEAFLEHYLRCKAKQPAATAAIVVVSKPQAKALHHLLGGMRLIAQLRAGTVLYVNTASWSLVAVILAHRATWTSIAASWHETCQFAVPRCGRSCILSHIACPASPL